MESVWGKHSISMYNQFNKGKDRQLMEGERMQGVFLFPAKELYEKWTF